MCDVIVLCPFRSWESTSGRDGGQDTWDAGQRSYQVTSARPAGAHRGASHNRQIRYKTHETAVSHTQSQTTTNAPTHPV